MRAAGKLFLGSADVNSGPIRCWWSSILAFVSRRYVGLINIRYIIGMFSDTCHGSKSLSRSGATIIMLAHCVLVLLSTAIVTGHECEGALNSLDYIRVKLIIDGAVILLT